MGVPQSLQNEHGELHGFLARAAREPGEIGQAAQLLTRILKPHFEKEESFALPPLGLLAALAKGRIDRGMGQMLKHTDWLRDHLEDALAEHRMALAALERLMQAARETQRFEYVEFAEKLTNHIRMEEEVFYPAAILVGEFLRIKLGADAATHTAQ